MACFVNMGETGIPFEPDYFYPELCTIGKAPEVWRFEKVVICKECRADWLQVMKLWWDVRRPRC